MVTRVDTKCSQCGAVVPRSRVAAHYSSCPRRPVNLEASRWVCPWCGRCEIVGLPAALHNAVFYHVCPAPVHETRIEFEAPPDPDHEHYLDVPPLLGPWWVLCVCGDASPHPTVAEAYQYAREHIAAALEAVDQ